MSTFLRGLLMPGEMPSGHKAVSYFLDFVTLGFVLEAIASLARSDPWWKWGSLLAEGIGVFLIAINVPQITKKLTSSRVSRKRYLFLLGGSAIGLCVPVILVHLAMGYMHGLSGEIDRVSTLDANTVYLVAAVRNDGRPTVAKDYTLRVVFSTGMKRNGILTATPEFRNIVREDGRIERLHRADALYEKTALTPIPTHALVRGTLIFTIPDVVLEAYQPGTSFILGFSDESGKKYAVKDKWDGSAPHDLIWPGFTPDVTPFPVVPAKQH